MAVKKSYSQLFRTLHDQDEQVWRAGHKDALVGKVSQWVDECRVANADLIRLSYMTPRHVETGSGILAAYLASIGKSDKLEDCYLHFKGAGARSTRRAIDSISLNWLWANPACVEWRSFQAWLAIGIIDGSYSGLPPGTNLPFEGAVLDVAMFLHTWELAFKTELLRLTNTDEYDGITIDDDHPYGTDVLAMYQGIQNAVVAEFGAGILLLPNLSASGTWDYAGISFIHDMVDIFGGVWNETGVTNDGTIKISDLEQHIDAMADLVALGKKVFVGAKNTVATDAGKMLAWAIYHLVCDEPHTWCGWTTGTIDTPDCDEWQYMGALDADIGTPTGVTTWPLPTVAQRYFTGGVAVANVKPNTGSGTSQTVYFDGLYREIYVNGARGAPTTSFTLAVGEGKLLEIVPDTTAAEKSVRFIGNPNRKVIFTRKMARILGKSLSLTFLERAVTVGSRDFASPVRISGHSYATAEVFEFEGDTGDGYIQKATLVPAGDPYSEDNP